MSSFFGMYINMDKSIIKRSILPPSNRVMPENSIHYLESYHPTWDTPSCDSSESMPCGGGDIGLNVWVEDGDVLFYLSRSGTFDENNTMLKLGRVRLHCTPNPFDQSTVFEQKLNLYESCVHITAQNDDVQPVHIKIWVEVFSPVVHVEVESKQNMHCQVIYENWRTADRELSKLDRMMCLDYMHSNPELVPVTTLKDDFTQSENELQWYHRNRAENTVFDQIVNQQHLDPIKDQLDNPVKDLTFGGLLKADGFIAQAPHEKTYIGIPYTGWPFQSDTAQKSFSISIFLHTSHGKDLETWKRGLRSKVTGADDREEAWQKNIQWWASFWNRSHVVINPSVNDESDLPWQVGRNYQLFRYQLGCNAQGQYPSKFNGGLFTYDPGLVDEKYDQSTADFRQWGGGTFTAQNQRLLYWPMLKSGDTEMMKAQFQFYQRGLKNAELRTQHYWGHDGASFAEQVSNYGLPLGDCYECTLGGRGLEPRPDIFSSRTLRNAKGEEVEVIDPGYLNNDWVSDHYDTVLEFCAMILDTRVYANDDITEYIPLIHSCVTFLDQHYQYWNKKLNGQKLGEDGKLILYPSTACETYKVATNPTNLIAGMTVVIKGLLDLPDTYSNDEQRQGWQAMFERLPEISYREMNGKKVISPAKNWERINNVELPFLYTIFPWKLHGVGKPELQVARDSWHHGADRVDQYDIVSWHQDAIFCANLGLTEEAAKLTIEKMKDSQRRYPTFWGPGHDWVPDQNWGGSGMIGVQEMLLYTADQEIRLLPAWPKNWDVSFKLHAPYETTVECTVKDGEIQSLVVTPESRRWDVVLGEGWSL